MADLILEPFAALQRWALPGDDPDWRALLGDYLRALAQASKASGAPVLGHIKVLALFADGTYFRASVVDAALPVTMEGRLPPQLHTLELTINLIVYGLEQAVLEQITAEVSAQLANKYQGEVITTTEAHSQHAHD